MRLKTILAALAAIMVTQGAMAQTVQPDAPAAVKAVGIGLPNQIIRSAPTTAAEDEDLTKALSSFKSATIAGRRDDFSALTGYLERHPTSGWSTSLQINVGDMQMDRGFFTRALASWEAAWRLGSTSNDRDTKLLVDHALAMAAKTRATFGQYDRAATMLSAARDRKIEGSATEQLQIVSDTLGQIKTNPKHVSVCGPQALQLLLRMRNPKEEVFDLHGYEAGLDGTTLAELSKLATRHNMAHRLVKWLPGQPIPTSGVVHWKAGHFAALLGHDGNDLIIADSAYPQGLRMSPAAFAEEASGYMLVPEDGKARSSLASVPVDVAASVRGKGPVQQMILNGIGDFLSGLLDRGGCPLCGSNIKEGSLAIAIQDTPVGYAPATGPSIFTTVFYDQRTAWQTATMPYANLGQKWSLSWTRYIDQGNYSPGGSVKRVTGAGTEYTHYDYNSSTGQFTPQYDDGSILRIVSTTPLVYERTTSDGTVETYSTDTGGNPYRRIYLTSIKDPQGNAITLGYQNFVLNTITDAYGRVTTITTDANKQITRIEDPFGRAAVFTYDFDKRLTSITDVLGLKSSFEYDGNSLISAMTTPYGRTTYAYTPPGSETAPRFAEIRDPLNNRMRNEWVDNVIPDAAPAGTVPTGMPLPAKADYLKYRNTFHWSKDAYVAAGCTPGAPTPAAPSTCDYTKARVTHFEHANTLYTIKALGVESVKQPLENRVFLQYPNQATNTEIGSYFTPSAAARVVNGSTTQLGSVVYDQTGYYKPLKVTDPAGRITDYTYGTNKIDVTSVKRTVAAGAQQTLMTATYDANHNPLTVTDAAGQTTTYTYNGRGQPLTVTDALGHVTTMAYDALGRLTTVTNANNAVAATYTYDALDRVATATDSEGWTVAYQYDAMNRRTRTTYPDGTFETRVYDKLDLVQVTDRTGRTWKYTHDANSRTTSTTNPMGQTIGLEYTPMGNLAALVDAKGNRTTWTYDVQARPTQKKFADNTTITYAYDPASGHLASTTDALGQVKQYAYTVDDQIASVSYANAVNPTAGVTMAYDPYYGYPTSMTDGVGTTTFAYNPVGSLGALQLSAETSPLTSAAVSYAYDALGRVVTRTAAGGTAETYGYDAIGRMTGHVDGLGTYTYAYLGQTSQVTSRTLAGSALATSWSYGTNLQDRRLTGITNNGAFSGQQTAFTYQTDVLGRITDQTQTSDATAAMPAQLTQAAQYNNLNQQTVVGSQTQTYDAVGQLTSDGLRSYSWDAEGRLTGITYPAEPGKSTTFTYDGFGRRQSIVSTPAGGGTSTDRRLLWCGSEICQSRTPTGSVLKEYLAEGENVTGGQKLFYGIDHQGSMRRAFTAASSPSYDYDPYGQQIQSGAPATDFTYAGLMALPESGLYLSSTRAYNPGVGRWLRRDMAGEAGDADANLYGYANGDPTNLVDPDGAAPQSILSGAAWGGIKGLGSTWLKGVSDGDYTFCEFGQTIRAGGLGFLQGGIEQIIGLNGSYRITGLVLDAQDSANSIASNTTVFPPGSFSISDWTGYPAGVPKPQGPFRIIDGTEYNDARNAANKANAAIRRNQGLVGQAVDIHEIQPVKFGGSATDPTNKIILPRNVHRQQVTPWWNQIQKDLGQ